MPKLGKRKKTIEKKEGDGYCRMCQKVKALDNFYEATNPFIDTSGHMSVCNICCNGIYDKYFSIYGTLDKSLDSTCRDLDVKFDFDALRFCQSHIEGMMVKGKKLDKMFGYYKSKLSSMLKLNTNCEYFRYKDGATTNSQDNNHVGSQLERNDDVDDDLKLFWGEQFSWEEYEFLERELAQWKQKHKCDNQSEITLLKEVCIKVLEIRQLRKVGKSTTITIKELQDLMKTASLDPAKANIADGGKSLDAFGLWLKDIEEYEPAEFFEDKKIYEDFDGFKKYADKYIYRPLKNLLSGSRDFNIDDSETSAIDDGNGDE
jgi:hypothetical protein